MSASRAVSRVDDVGIGAAGDMLGGQMKERRSRRLPGVGLSRCFRIRFHSVVSGGYFR